MREIKVGDKLKCIFDAALPGNKYGPPVKAGDEYECKEVFTDRSFNDHIDVGLPVTDVNFVKSYANRETLPWTARWCHPNRFIVIK